MVYLIVFKLQMVYLLCSNFTLCSMSTLYILSLHVIGADYCICSKKKLIFIMRAQYEHNRAAFEHNRQIFRAVQHSIIGKFWSIIRSPLVR